MSIGIKIKRIALLSDKQLQEYFDEHSLNKLHEMKIYSDDMYYNQGKSSGLSDWQYDMLRETLNRRDPNYVVPVGARIREGDNRVKLPFWLGSMDKFKPSNTKELKRWITSNRASQYILEDKLDGVSCLLTYSRGALKLYTRGDGVIGADISYLAQYFKTVPKDLPEDISVRGELIMHKKVFEKKYSKIYANPRNLVAGMTGAKTIKKGIKDVQFIAYEIVGSGKMPKPSEQLNRLTKLGFTAVRYKLVPTVNMDGLMATLIQFVETSPYEIDGVIVQPNTPYTRNRVGNPKYAFAFKMRMKDNIVKARVDKVLWAISKWGQIKPRVKIEPKKLGGVTITYATGFNAKFIHDNKIGPGAVVEITRSGDVIPYIVSVVKAAKKPQMPTGKWGWNATHVDIVAKEGFSSQICIKLITSFLHQMGFKYIGERRVAKMYAGGADSILRVLLLTIPELRTLGFGPGEAKIIYNSIHKTLKAGMDLAKMLGASGVCGQGIGSKKIAVLLDAYPDILERQSTISKNVLYKLIIVVPGFADKTTNTVVKNIAWAAKWAKAMSYLTTYTTKKKLKGGGSLFGYNIVISGTLVGYTRVQAAHLIEEAGGVLKNKVYKPRAGLKQIVVIVGASTTKKAKDAKKYGIKTYNQKDLTRMLKEGPN